MRSGGPLHNPTQPNQMTTPIINIKLEHVTAGEEEGTVEKRKLALVLEPGMDVTGYIRSKVGVSPSTRLYFALGNTSLAEATTFTEIQALLPPERDEEGKKKIRPPLRVSEDPGLLVYRSSGKRSRKEMEGKEE